MNKTQLIALVILVILALIMFFLFRRLKNNYEDAQIVSSI